MNDNIVTLDCTSYRVVSNESLSEDLDELYGSRWFQFFHFDEDVCTVLDCPDDTFVIANCSESISTSIIDDGFSFIYKETPPSSSVLNNFAFNKAKAKSTVDF